MPDLPSHSEPDSRAHQFHLTRRHLLGAGTALLVSSLLPISASAAPEAAFSIAPDTSAAEGYPEQDQSAGWPPPPPPSSIVSVPYRSQLDGSPQARANCGPASLSMLLARFGDGTSIDELRHSVNRYMNNWARDNGATWEALAYAAAVRGYQIIDLYGGPGKYRRWSVDSLVAETQAGNAAIILVRYRALPGKESSLYLYNHYIVILGVDSEGSIVYHDPSYPDATTGSYLRMTRKQLSRAWSSVTSGIVYTGMAIKPKKK